MDYNGISHTSVESLVFAADWEILPLPDMPEPASSRVWLFPPSQGALQEEITAAFPQERAYLLDSSAATLVGQEIKRNADTRLLFVTRTSWRTGVSDDDVRAFFQLFKALRGNPYLFLDVFTDKAITSPMFHSVTHPVDGVYVGLAQTLAKERPEWKVRSFSLRELTPDALRPLLDKALPTLPGIPVCIAGAQYGSARLRPAALHGWPERSAFKPGGVYVIIGGAGGLGGMLAEYLAARYGARLAILGRRPQNPDMMQKLRKRGAAEAVYHQVDLGDRFALQAVMDGYPVINGVIHSALVLEDASLAAMDEAALFSVLRPKLHGAYHLVRALKGKAIDFCLFFSSIQSYIANPGQANYTAACVAKDAFADLLHNGLAINSKVINWGFWGNVGVVATEKYRERMRKLEIGSIEIEEGLAIIERFLVSDCRQISVVKGSGPALKRLHISQAAGERPWLPAGAHRPAEVRGGDGLIPPFHPDEASVARNRAISSHLQEYARWHLGRVALPDAVLPRYDKLLNAIRAIPAGRSAGREHLLRQYPELAGHIRLLDACLAHLPAILQGKTPALSVIFPGGGFDLVEPVYRDNPIADYFNRVVARIVANYQKNRYGRPLRIIEIGAGTGSTTQFVLPELAREEVSYTFTDLSLSFLNRARSRFAAYPFMAYEICNISNPPEYDEPFDVVIATNVMHATANLPDSLRHVRKLLRQDGIFVLNEITACQDYATLTFGLTDGWWLSQDHYRIPNSPLLSGESWRRLLSQAGFSGIDAHGGEEQQVIVGHAGAAASGASAEGAAHERQPVSAADGAAHERQSDGAAHEVQSAAAGQGHMEDFLKRVVADVLQFNPGEIDADMPFNEMGVDSLIAMELLKPIKEKVGYLPATLLFEYPTVRQLAAHLLHSAAARREPLTAATAVAIHPPEVDAAGQPGHHQDVTAQIRAVIADTMMMERADLEPDTPFQDYGIDSIISLDLVRALKDLFGHLPATILFEYPTLGQLSAYLAAIPARNANTDRAGQKSDNPQVNNPPVNNPPRRPVNAAPWRQDDIAIIGMSARLPQAEEVEDFWRNLRQGRDCTAVIPPDRWLREGLSTGMPADGRASYTDRGAFIDDIDAFDHVFFHLTPNEAARMDPQERILLEQTYRVILDAGYSRRQLSGSDTAVFVGVMNGDYAWHTPVDEKTAPATSLFWSMANRASYFFDWRGPSMAVDTACSASLTALHLACQSLKNRDCRQAVISGVNLITHPRHYELLCGLHMLSREGKCKPFGAGADGFVDGEGAVCLMIKRAEDALNDEDRIYAVIKGSAINAGGRGNGYTAPNPDAQRTLINKALKAADAAPGHIGYIEAHGTGTELGDPIEFNALTQSYGGAATHTIRLGSVKSNVGHLESAAGLCGLLKAVLQMRHGELAPSLHAQTLNPHLDFANSPFILNQALLTWPESLPRMSAVSSFGAGGGNAHVIVQGVPQTSDAPTGSPAEATPDPYVIPLSHHTSAGLQMTLDRLRHWLGQGSVDMDALAYTLSCARDHYKHRVAIVCRDETDLLRQLSADLQSRATCPDKARGGAGTLPVDPTRTGARNIAALPADPDRTNAHDIAALYESGVELPWSVYYPRRRLMPVPQYVFIRHRHWIDSRESRFNRPDSLAGAHLIKGEAMVPAAWTLSALCETADGGGFVNILWQDKITSPESVELIERDQRLLFVGPDGRKTFCCAERAPAVAALPDAGVPEGESGVPGPEEMDDAHWVGRQDIYADFKRRGYDYGPVLQGIQWAQVKPGRVRAFLHADRDWGRLVSPALLDAGLQLAILMPGENTVGNGESAVFMPYHLDKLVIRRLPDNEAVYCDCREINAGRSPRARTFDFYFTDRQGLLLLKLEKLVSVVIAPGDPGRRLSPVEKFEVFNINLA